MKVQQFQSCLKPTNHDAPISLDTEHWQLGFTNSFIITETVLSLSRILNRGQLNLDRFKFWLSTSQLFVLDVSLRDAFA